MDDLVDFVFVLIEPFISIYGAAAAASVVLREAAAIGECFSCEGCAWSA